MRPSILRTTASLALLLAFCTLLERARAESAAPLELERTIALVNTSGRIDHMAVDLARKRLFVAELGNGTVDVVDLASGTVVRRIKGLREPQGVGYSDKADLLVVASAGDGSVRFYSGADMSPVASLSLGDDADNVRIDPRTGNVVVGYGSGGLAIIDPVTRAKIADITLPGHPEGFQIDAASGTAFVNIPDNHQIAIVDLTTGRTAAVWRVPGIGGNFPMAFAPSENLVAAVFRSPPRLILIDAGKGNVIGTFQSCSDADDVFFDDRRKRIYVSCGSGEIDAWQREASGYRPMPATATDGSARTSLFVPEFDRLFVARRAGLLGSTGSIGVYRATTDTNRPSS